MSDPFQEESDSVEDAIAEYLEAEKTAKLECLEKLEAAWLKAVADKKPDKARKIIETKRSLVAHDLKDALHPFVTLRNEIKSTKWHNAQDRRLWNQFHGSFKLKNAKGDGGNWAVVDANAIASTTGKKHIHLWVFDEKRTKSILKRFVIDTKYKQEYVKAK